MATLWSCASFSCSLKISFAERTSFCFSGSTVITRTLSCLPWKGARSSTYCRESWDAGINTHLRPLALLTQQLYDDFATNPGSAVVAIASINATLGNAINPIYSAAKGGMLSLVRSLADRLARDNIRINAVSPGQILTAMTKPAVDNLPEGWFERRILLERLGAADDVGRVVRFLLSNEASYITAAEIVVDGGNISSQRQ